MFKLATGFFSWENVHNLHLMACLIIISWKAANLARRSSRVASFSDSVGVHSITQRNKDASVKESGPVSRR